MDKTESITLGGGCFWCVEAIFQRLEGVTSVKPGYAGGTMKNPTYELVCRKVTGHAEVIQIEYNPEIVSLESILEVFWQAHDPTTLNRQGNDEGPQYRSIILYNSEEQKSLAIRSREKAAQLFSDPIVTEIVPLNRFYLAEAVHHDFYNRNPTNPYCMFVIHPKLLKFEKH